MNPPPSPKPVSAWRRYGQEGLSLWWLGLANLRERWWQFFLIAGIGAALVLTIGREGGWDDQLLAQIRQPGNQALTQTARFLSFWGDVIWILILAPILFVMGVIFGCPRLRQVAWVALLAVLASSVIVNVFRPTLGRARPYTQLPGAFHGPTMDSKYFGFPSGHATSGFAPAAAIAAAVPVIGVPCLIVASGISWSRMQLNRHRPLDVMTGAAMGTLIGLCFGTNVTGAKFRLRKKRGVSGEASQR